jgi:hypothetical protein
MSVKHFEILEGSERTTWTHRIQVWDSWYEHKLGEDPDRTYYRNSLGRALFVLNQELRHRPVTKHLPDD